MDIFGRNLTGDSAKTQYCFPQVKGSCPRSQTLIHIRLTVYIITAFIILMTISGNLLIIISIAHFKQLHSPTNLLILSLAFTDWFLGVFILPCSVIRTVENCWYFGETFCKIHSSLDVMLGTASLLHMGLISFDRYQAICKPLQYRTLITMHKVAAIIGITWLFSFVFGFWLILSKNNFFGVGLLTNSCTGICVSFFNKKEGAIASFVPFFISSTVMIGLYMKIFHVAKVQARKINLSLGITIAQHDKNNCMSEQREKKAAKTLAIVLGVFLLCWLPYVLMFIIATFLDTIIPTIIFQFLSWLSYINSTCNPLIYGFFYPWFQRVFKMILSGQIFQTGSSLLNIYAVNN